MKEAQEELEYFLYFTPWVMIWNKYCDKNSKMQIETTFWSRQSCS